jgi:hypothetical protein
VSYASPPIDAKSDLRMSSIRRNPTLDRSPGRERPRGESPKRDARSLFRRAVSLVIPQGRLATLPSLAMRTYSWSCLTRSCAPSAIANVTLSQLGSSARTQALSSQRPIFSLRRIAIVLMILVGSASAARWVRNAFTSAAPIAAGCFLW